MEVNKRKCKALSLNEKFKLILEVEKGFKKKKDIAREFEIPASTLSTVMKNKKKILSAFEQSSIIPDRKRLKTSSFPDLEEAMLKWMKSARERNFPISGNIIREKAEQFAKEMDHADFCASSGWLDKFKLRNGIVQKAMSGESADVSESDCENYITNVLPALLEKYEAKNIFNADETGLFFKCLPSKTLAFKGEDCFGGKKSKERITVMVASNMSGTEKLKLLVIGKSAKPRCFAGIKSLPVIYENNKKSWMTASIYESWIQKMDRKFHCEGRKILLFVDNCPAHPKVLLQELKAIRVVFLPPNMTSKLQPMDQGIINNLKQHYRKRCVRKMLTAFDQDQRHDNISLLDCIMMLQKAWSDVKATTIVNCFRKAGFIKLDIGVANEDDLEENVMTPEEWKTFQKCSDCNIDFETYVNVDLSLPVVEALKENEILQHSENKRIAKSGAAKMKRNKILHQNPPIKFQM